VAVQLRSKQRGSVGVHACVEGAKRGKCQVDICGGGLYLLEQ
jgi:hypothetical protein